MYQLLAGVRVVEAASFIAAPSCGLYLMQMGAEVIRIDPLRGGPDIGRWPLAADGRSLYWEGLNKGKKSVAIDLASPEGRELAQALITAPGEAAGLFVTNQPAGGLFGHEVLAAKRADLITCRVMGWGDGRQAVDYTINCMVGVPQMTGPAGAGPVNHALPAWDLLAGAYSAFSLLAAERARREHGRGAELRVPLGELAIATMGNLGQIAHSALSGEDRPQLGNDLYGSFGRDFATRDGRRVMLVALTPRQWKGLVSCFEIATEVATLARELEADFADEGTRFVHRARLFALLEGRIGALTLSELAERFDRFGICWGPYRTVRQALDEDPRFAPAPGETGGLLEMVTHPAGTYATPGAAATLMGAARQRPGTAPVLGQHTEEVLEVVLGLGAGQIGALRERGVIAGA